MDVAVWAVVAGVVAWKFAGKAAQLVSGTAVALLGTVVKAAVIIAPLAAVAGRLLPGHGGGVGVLWAVLAAVVVVAGAWPAWVIKRELWPSLYPPRVRWRLFRAHVARQWAHVAGQVAAGRADAERWSDAVRGVAAARVRARAGRKRAAGVPGVLPGDRGGPGGAEMGAAGPPGAVPGERPGPGAGRAPGGVLGGRGVVDRGPRLGGVDPDLAALEEAGKRFRAAAEAAGIRV